jgi:cytochrome c peroxidase
MRKSGILGLTAIVLLMIISWINAPKKTHPIKFPIPKGWPQPLYDFKSNPLTEEGFALGKKLFYDGRLSKDNSISCGTCHQQFAAFTTFDHPLSHGFNNQQTSRNAPALQNLAWQSNFMADGGITHLDLQPLAPITAENEMAETLENIIAKIKTDKEYAKLFQAAYGDASINTQRIGKALSQFMLLMISSNSKYDKVMRGTDSFSLPEKLGYGIFQQKCASCHPAPLFTDNRYSNAGLPQDEVLKDQGRMRITNNPADSLKFKVPSLRNIALTAPYGHDGRFFSLGNVLEHYRKQMVLGPTTDPQLSNRLPLSNFEIGQLKAFLNTLTDSVFIKDPRFSEPGMTNAPGNHGH